jgi:glycosyltransferase involved in cell wall biosynthesis
MGSSAAVTQARAERSSHSPEVTVVIPTRDGWDLLPMTMTSALEQEDVALEVVVVDDGSQDGTAAGLATWPDPRLRVCRESGRGVGAARNRGIAEARGEWIAFLDHDDLWAPRKLRAQIDRARAAGADFVYSAVVFIDSDSRVLRFVPPLPVPELRRELARGNRLLGGQSNVVARAAFVHELGGFDAELKMHPDWEMWIRMAWAGKAVTCDQIHVAYRIHAETMTSFTRDVTPDIDRMLARHAPERMDPSEARTFADRWRAAAHRRRGDRIAASRQYLNSAWRHRHPGMLVRGLAVLMGESVMRVGDPEARMMPPDGEPAWLARYRPQKPGVD